jgi:hypothetical protein
MRLLAVIIAVIWLWPLAEAQSKKAFIVGIGDYEELTDLQKTIGDARGYADVFGGTLGFEVTKLENPSLLEFDIAFTAFLETVGAGDDVVFIFSGHGWSDGAENYLAPADAPRAAPEAFVKRSTVALNSFVLAELRKRRPNLSFAIIDACRDNPFDTGTRSAFDKGLARVSAGEGELILYSAGSLQKSLDRLTEEDTSPYSVFTRILLPKLSDPSVPLAQIADEARSEVQKLADTIDHRQRPEMMLGVSLGYCLAGECRGEGDSLFNREQQAWISATSQSDGHICDAYRNFLRLYPNGAYGDVARDRLSGRLCTTLDVGDAGRARPTRKESAPTAGIEQDKSGDDGLCVEINARLSAELNISGGGPLSGTCVLFDRKSSAVRSSNSNLDSAATVLKAQLRSRGAASAVIIAGCEPAEADNNLCTDRALALQNALREFGVFISVFAEPIIFPRNRNLLVRDEFAQANRFAVVWLTK